MTEAVSGLVASWYRGCCAVRPPKHNAWFSYLQDNLCMTQELHRLGEELRVSRDDLRVSREESDALRKEVDMLRSEMETRRMDKEDSPSKVVLAWLAKEMVEDASREYFAKRA